VTTATAPSRRPGTFALVVRNPLGLLGLSLTVLVLLFGLVGPLLSPISPLEQDIMNRMSGPTGAHPLGTDQFGRDVLARMFQGYRSSLAVSGASVLLALLIGGPLGVTAAYWGGAYDRIVMRFMDVLLAFPIILLAIGIVAVLGPGSLNTALAIGIVYVPTFARLLRGPALVLQKSDFVQAARARGARDTPIVFRHIVPNIVTVTLVQTTLALSTAILVEASLSFLGLGTQPPNASLGAMLAEGRAFLTINPWPSLFSGLAILLASFGFNLLGDSLRDALDPRLRGQD
jgi:peptide/nickel transport system permease protein